MESFAITDLLISGGLVNESNNADSRKAANQNVGALGKVQLVMAQTVAVARLEEHLANFRDHFGADSIPGTARAALVSYGLCRLF